MNEVFFLFFLQRIAKGGDAYPDREPGSFSHWGPGGWGVVGLGEQIPDIQSANFLTDQQEGQGGGGIDEGCVGL